MAVNASISAGSATGSVALCSSQRMFFSAYGTLCRKTRLALVKPAKAVRSQRLHHAHINVSIV